MNYPFGPVLDRVIGSDIYFPKGVIVFDRDGTLVEDAGQHNDSQKLVFMPGAFAAIKLLTSLNYGIAIASNQSGIESEKFSLEKLFEFNETLKQKLCLGGAGEIHLIAICPHIMATNCGCRKPKAGLLDAIAQSGLGTPKIFIGDSDSDYAAAQAFRVPFLRANGTDLHQLLSDWLELECV